MTQFPVQYILYAYLYLGIGLLVFNMLFAESRGFRTWLLRRRMAKWESFLSSHVLHDSVASEEHAGSKEPEKLSDQELSKLVRKLGNTKQLRAFNEVLETFEEDRMYVVRAWFARNGVLLNDLAVWYRKRESMERAFYAWFLCRFRLIGASQTELLSILRDYMENSTVFCRENVLNAVCSSGNVQAVEAAYALINDHRYSHNERLLSDGLLTFTGDRQQLAEALWAHHGSWNDELMRAVVQFITRSDGVTGFDEPFLAFLQSNQTSVEVRLSIIRYFARHPYEPAREQLLNAVRNVEQVSLAIVAAFALGSYPGEDSIAALKYAVCSSNWYVRTNAAASLVKLARDLPERDEVLACSDRYGAQSIAYQLERVGEKR